MTVFYHIHLLWQRRLKENVEVLKPKQEQIIDLELTPLQKTLYRSIYQQMVHGLDSSDNVTRSGMNNAGSF